MKMVIDISERDRQVLLRILDGWMYCLRSEIKDYGRSRRAEDEMVIVNRLQRAFVVRGSGCDQCDDPMLKGVHSCGRDSYK